MKSLTERIVAPILLLFSAIFAVLSILSLPNLTPVAYAIEPGTSEAEITAPGETNLTTPTQTPTTNNPTNTPAANEVQTPGEYNPGTSEAEIEAPGETNLVTGANGENGTNGENGETSGETASDPNTNLCTTESGILSWIVCPTTKLLSSAIDGIYNLIGDLFLVINPISMDDSSPVYVVWKYMRSLTNIVFMIFLLIVIYSQITGLGIDNYGIKRILPRLIIAVLLVNLSFLICTLAIDISNIFGNSLRDFFGGIQANMLSASGAISEAADISLSTLVTAVLGGGMVAGIAIGATTGFAGLFWMLIPVLIGAVISVVAGLITIAARQAVVVLLVMIAPLAFVAYLLPNTERWFIKWKELFTRMLVFYPMFSFLFGASQLAGWALIASASSPFGIVIGLGVQIFPLFFSVSLMKMSGTILSSLNDGLHRLAAPMQRSATGWALEHAEQRRQHHFANSELASARLRRYLDYRRELRMNDTKNSLDTRRNRALERALTHSAAITGRDEEGNMTWEEKPNRYTRNAKTANFYSTRANTAHAAYQNTLTGYGRHFSDVRSQRLSDAHGEAFLDSMAQQFLTTNEAQADQEWLLGKYLSAATNSGRHRYEYNRLIRDAAGGLGHNGESSIMGQVIVNSSMIENRRRSEARIIATKFGVSKSQMRGMTFDKAHINDNGYETDEDGNQIEDTQYRLIEYDENGRPTGYRRQKWQHYIGVHKKTGKEITKEEYDTMSASEQDNYKKVRYFDITNDDGDPVQRVYEDDAGYMKELLRDDIAIGDPINRRYLTEIGVKHADGEETGILRRYHSTISAAMLETRYKEHAAEVTPMITAQANAGYITSIGQYNIANLQSLSVAAKAGSFLQNDGYAFRDWSKLIQCAFDDDLFAQYFTDNDVENYRNVNGVHLDGLRWNETTQQWDEINHNDSNITLEDKKNCIRHKIIPKAAAKLVGMLNRDISPAVLDSMKPDNLEALKGLLGTLAEIGVENFAEDRTPEQRLKGDTNIFDSSDPKVLKSQILATQAYIDNVLGRDTEAASDDTAPAEDSGSDSGDSGSGPRQKLKADYIQREGFRILAQRKARQERAAKAKESRDSIPNIRDIVNGFLSIDGIDITQAGKMVENYISDSDRLGSDETFQASLHEIVKKYTEDPRAGSTEEVIDQITGAPLRDIERSSYENIQNMRQEIDGLFDSFFG